MGEKQCSKKGSVPFEIIVLVDWKGVGHSECQMGVVSQAKHAVNT
jgi:hypothetical protein